MSMFSRDNDESYEDYLKEDGSMFGKERKETFIARKERAAEIASGLVSGLFEKDEKVWKEVAKIKEKEE